MKKNPRHISRSYNSARKNNQSREFESDVGQQQRKEISLKGSKVTVQQQVIGLKRMRPFAVLLTTIWVFAGLSQGANVSTERVRTDFQTCQKCHDGERPLSMSKGLGHQGMSRGDSVRGHGDADFRCQKCHDESSPRRFRLLTKESLSVTETPVLCGQCHGLVKRDWNLGLHGKSVGGWARPQRQHHSCLDCHDPHQPGFPQMRAEPPPQKPRLHLLKDHKHENTGS